MSYPPSLASSNTIPDIVHLRRLFSPAAYLVGFVEEVFDPFTDPSYKSKRIADDIETEHQYVELFQSLVRVVFHDFRLKLLWSIELIFPLKVTQPKTENKEIEINHTTEYSNLRITT